MYTSLSCFRSNRRNCSPGGNFRFACHLHTESNQGLPLLATAVFCQMEMNYKRNWPESFVFNDNRKLHNFQSNAKINKNTDSNKKDLYKNRAREMIVISRWCSAFDYNDNSDLFDLIDCKQLNVCFYQKILTQYK